MKYVLILLLLSSISICLSAEKDTLLSPETEIVLFESRFENNSVIILKYKPNEEIQKYCTNEIYNSLLRIGRVQKLNPGYTGSETARYIASVIRDKIGNQLVKLGGNIENDKIVEAVLNSLADKTKK